jgi:hypothetical protein
LAAVALAIACGDGAPAPKFAAAGSGGARSGVGGGAAVQTDAGGIGGGAGIGSSATDGGRAGLALALDGSVAAPIGRQGSNQAGQSVIAWRPWFDGELDKTGIYAVTHEP